MPCSPELGLSAAQAGVEVERARKDAAARAAIDSPSEARDTGCLPLLRLPGIIMLFPRCIGIVSFALAAGHSAAAAPAEAPHASPADVAAAQALFEQGRALM